MIIAHAVKQLLEIRDDFPVDAIAPLRATKGDSGDWSLFLENEIARHTSRSLRFDQMFCQLLAQAGIALDAAANSSANDTLRADDRHRPACATDRSIQN